MKVKIEIKGKETDVAKGKRFCWRKEIGKEAEGEKMSCRCAKNPSENTYRHYFRGEAIPRESVRQKKYSIKGGRGKQTKKKGGP